MSRHTSWLLTAILCCIGVVSSAGQSKSANAAPQSPSSLEETLRNFMGKEIHIFYVHGIGSYGPNDRDSLAMRKNLCDYLKDCTSPAGMAIGQWDYAERDEFRLDAAVPMLEYFDERIWKSEEEWHAAAPYAVHFQLARSSGQTLYVDEINWWPLTFSLKCRQFVASDASFVAPNKEKIATCSTREPNPGVPHRFKSYDWISMDEATRLRQLRPNGARANRDLKTGLMDWGFSDAVMVLGPLRSYVLDGIRQLILKSVSDVPGGSEADPEKPRSNQEFILVTHSLGSYLTFSALDDIDLTEKTAAVEQTKSDLNEILKRTSLVVFFANQLRLLELASLAGPGEKNIATHLQDWGKTRCEYLKSLPDAPQECKYPRIIALNDPSDLLTWTVPALDKTVDVALRDLAIISQPLSFYCSHLGSNHQERPRMARTKKTTRPPNSSLNESRLSPLYKTRLCVDREDCATWHRFAARLKLLSSAIARKYRICRNSISACTLNVSAKESADYCFFKQIISSEAIIAKPM